VSLLTLDISFQVFLRVDTAGKSPDVVAGRPWPAGDGSGSTSVCARQMPANWPRVESGSEHWRRNLSLSVSELDPERGCERLARRTDTRDAVESIAAQLPLVVHEEEDDVAVAGAAE